jgi:hypothetical protein
MDKTFVQEGYMGKYTYCYIVSDKYDLNWVIAVGNMCCYLFYMLTCVSHNEDYSLSQDHTLHILVRWSFCSHVLKVVLVFIGMNRYMNLSVFSI